MKATARIRAGGFALVSALLVRASAPPHSFSMLAFVGLVPVLVYARTATWCARLAIGLVLGVALNALLSGTWATEAIVAFTGASWIKAWLLVALLVFWQGSSLGLAFGASVGLERLRVPFPLALGLAVAALEWLFPMWLPTSLSLAVEPSSALGQHAALGGTPLVAGLLVAINGAVVDAFATRRRLSLAVVTASLVAGEIPLRRADKAEAVPLRVMLVQANATTEAPLRAHAVASRALKEPADLVIWSEGATGMAYGSDALDALARKVVREAGAPTLFGTDVRLHGSAGDGGLVNSAVLAGDDGARGRHDKTKLFAIGETSAFAPLGALGEALVPRRDREVYATGQPARALRLHRPSGAVTLHALVCLEDATPFEGSTTEEPGLLVGLSNDRWFGASAEPWLHEALARYRAVEAGVPLVRVANTGVSGAYDRNGRVLARGPTGQRWSAVVTTHAEAVRSRFARIGVGRFRTGSLLLLVVSSLAALVPRLRRAARAAPVSPPALEVS